MRYGPDVLAGGARRAAPERSRVLAELGLVIEDATGEFCGAVVGWERDAVILEDRHGKRRAFPFGAAPFLLEGEPVTLVRPGPAAVAGMPPAGSAGGSAGGPGVAGVADRRGGVPAARGSAFASGTRRTASGSIAAQAARAKVARASRIYVEGRHDAELVERIWGDDLRDVGVVVEFLGGIDDLPAIVDDFAPGPGRRLGVLVDHLLDGTKESQIAALVRSPDVLIAGHPYIDVWAAVKPSVVGIGRWPDVPRGVPWKEGVLRAIGWQLEPAAAWQRILRSVTSFADLEPAFLGKVEELIDFVTEPGSR